MIREVYIDNQLIDIESDNAAGYIFTSPIFRDITKILSNRTTTYKISKTQRNLSVFGLADNPDVVADFPYKEHTFSEYRDGLLFISGLCTLLKITDNELELSVIWGNTINLLSLRDLKLTDLDSTKYVLWNDKSAFLPNTSTDQEGFIAIDFGRGLNDFKYIHPSITMQGVLDIITESTGIKFTYPDRFNNVFKKRWIPLLDKKANEITWESTYSVLQTNSISRYGYVEYRKKEDDFNVEQKDGYITVYRDKVEFKIIDGSISMPRNQTEYDVCVRFNYHTYNNHYFICETEYNPITDKTEAIINADLKIDLPAEGIELEHTFFNVSIFKIPKGEYPIETESGAVQNYKGSLSAEEFNFQLFMYHYPKEVPFGYNFPVAPNLPDMSVVDYLKTIMQMYGLYTYYNYKLDNTTIQFISIDDIYKYKFEKDLEKGIQAYDWTNKLVSSNRGRFNVSFVYGDYAQKNNFAYSKDNTVLTNADGYLLIENETIADTKELIELKFAPSDNIEDDKGNVIAKIELYDADGNINSLKSRILTQNVYISDQSREYISAYFDEYLKFSGEKGLITKYYATFQHILRRPVVVECYVYLSDVELYTYREINPIYIDGVYYMPIEVTVQTNSLAVCKLIKMPYRE